jgi:type I restriction enzyme, R subunit
MDRASNFDHLEELDVGLAAYGRFAERYFVDDANTALMKARQFAERLAVLVAEHSGLTIEPRVAFSDVLRAIQVDGAAPREITDVLHKLRRVGNEAAHDGHEERRDAFEAIKLCHRLGVWWRATRTAQPKLTIAFVPPRPSEDDSAALKDLVDDLKARLAEVETESQRLAREAKEAWDARLSAEERASIAEEERAIYEALALEAEKKATAAPPPSGSRIEFATAAAKAAKHLDLDEADTRLLVDEQLRQSGWEADTLALRYAAGTRPEKGRRMAIAEWPTASGPADYALFIDEILVGLVEAKRRRREVAAALDQSERYSRGVNWGHGGNQAGGPWNESHVPFVFATNGRGYYPQFATQSGIWFRDVRRATNAARPLEGWPTPDGLAERLEVDEAAAEAALREKDFDFGFALRPYQVAAIRRVEEALAAGQREMLVAMATGTGKTKLSIALIYRMLEAKRFLRVCFVVDRSALGEEQGRARPSGARRAALRAAGRVQASRPDLRRRGRGASRRDRGRDVGAGGATAHRHVPLRIAPLRPTRPLEPRRVHGNLRNDGAVHDEPAPQMKATGRP